MAQDTTETEKKNSNRRTKVKDISKEEKEQDRMMTVYTKLLTPPQKKVKGGAVIIYTCPSRRGTSTS